MPRIWRRLVRSAVAIGWDGWISSDKWYFPNVWWNTQQRSCEYVFLARHLGFFSHMRSFIRRSGVARPSPGIWHTPISDVLVVTTSGRYRDVCVASQCCCLEAVWSRGHLGWIGCWRPDWRGCPLPQNFGLRLRIIVPFRCSSLLISIFCGG
jgi:hypothetical protein